MDTAGQDEYSAMREHYMHHGEALVYSIDIHSSFEELARFYEQTPCVKDRDSFPIIVVGTRCDLEFQRQVPTSEGRALAQRLGCAFIETSAKECVNVNEAFIGLVGEIKKYLVNIFPNEILRNFQTTDKMIGDPQVEQGHGSCDACVIA